MSDKSLLPPTSATDIAERLAAVKQAILLAEQKYQRQPHSVKLLAVSKAQPIEKIVAAIKAGQNSFAENYLQEALSKIAQLKSYHLEWHYIGRIQANKTRKIAENFAWVHSLSNFKIAERLNAQRPDDLDRLNICVQINIDQQATKSGIAPADLFNFLQQLNQLKRLRIRGLMTIAQAGLAEDELRAQFHELYAMLQRLRAEFVLDTLSMGMSDDFKLAIAEGSTCVRIGSAIFGERIIAHDGEK